MLDQIRRFFAPPVFQDDEKTRVAGLLNVIIIAIFVAAIVFPALLLSTGTIGAVEVTAGAVVAGLMFGLRYLMRHGRLLLAGIGAVLILYLVTTVLIIYDGTILNGLTAFYLLVVIMAALLTGNRSAIVFLFLSLVAMFVILQLELKGIVVADAERAGMPTF
jgi:hypothetical protein